MPQPLLPPSYLIAIASLLVTLVSGIFAMFRVQRFLAQRSYARYRRRWRLRHMTLDLKDTDDSQPPQSPDC